MTKRTVSYDPTPENIVNRMLRGQAYTTYRIAAMFKLKTADVRSTIQQLAADGFIRVEMVKRETYYVRPMLDESAEPKAAQAPAKGPDIELTIALRQGPPDLKNTMVGYDAEISRRSQLCMLARGAR